MYKKIFMLAILVSVTLVSCAKSQADTAISNYEKAIDTMVQALASGDNTRIQAAEQDISKAGEELEKVSGSLSWSQKIKLAEISVKGSGAALQGLGTGLGDLLKSEEAQELNEELTKSLMDLNSAVEGASGE